MLIQSAYMATTNRRAKPTPKPESAAPIKRRKAVRKDQHIIIRVTVEQKELMRSAAEKAGFGLSGWILATAIRAAVEGC